MCRADSAYQIRLAYDLMRSRRSLSVLFSPGCSLQFRDSREPRVHIYPPIPRNKTLAGRALTTLSYQIYHLDRMEGRMDLFLEVQSYICKFCSFLIRISYVRIFWMYFNIILMKYINFSCTYVYL